MGATFNAQPAYASFGEAAVHLSRGSDSEGGTSNSEIESAKDNELDRIGQLLGHVRGHAAAEQLGQGRTL
jgi:hypothetical protein